MTRETRFSGCEIPGELLDLFALHDGAIWWTAAKPDSAHRAKRAPWGSRAGGVMIAGRGQLIQCSMAKLLSNDVAFALRNAGDWPWQVAGGEGEVFSGVPGDLAALALKRWEMRDGVIVWRETRGDHAQAGQEARGYMLSGPRGAVITTGSIGYLKTDVYALLTGSL